MSEQERLPISESLIITLAGILVAGMGMGLWYFRSILLTSRCTEASCCCLHWKNKPLRESNLLQILDGEQAPTITVGGPALAINQQRRPSSRASEHHIELHTNPSRPPSHERTRPFRVSSPDPPPPRPDTVVEVPGRSFSFREPPEEERGTATRRPPSEETRRVSYQISPLGLP